ncbi:hypothetical protein [Glycomyces tarimensis]
MSQKRAASLSKWSRAPSLPRSGFAPQHLASLRNVTIANLKAIGGQGITALGDRIANHPYTLPLEILGLAVIEPTYQPRRLCLCPGFRSVLAWRQS